MKEKLAALLQEGMARIEAAKNENDLQETKAFLLGKQSPLGELMKELPKLDVSERPVMGKLVNEVKQKLSARIDEVRENLKKVGAPYEPEMIGITRARFRETYAGVPSMRARYFSLDLVDRLGLTGQLLDELFGKGGVWEI